MKKKKLIVLIPHYNDPIGLQLSINSIQEEFTMDVLVIDDGSTVKPNENEILENYKNGRIFFKYLNRNSGLSHALNVGIEYAISNNYDFTGRLDCRDLCVKDKFSKQLEFLDMNKNIKLLGTWAKVVNEDQIEQYILRHPEKHDEIKKKIYLNNMFVHPSVVLRTEVFRDVGKYDIKYTKAAQDYDLFFRIVKHHETANFPEALLIYEISENSISSNRRKLQVKNRIKIILDNFYFGFYPIYGIVRNSFLYFISRETTTKLKSVIGKNDKR